jgi:hypothetical protein
VIKLNNNHKKFLLNAMSTNNNKPKFHKAKRFLALGKEKEESIGSDGV